MNTNLTSEEIERIRERAVELTGVARQQYLAGIRVGLEAVAETEAQEGTLAGGAEIQAFYDFLDSESLSSGENSVQISPSER